MRSKTSKTVAKPTKRPRKAPSAKSKPTKVAKVPKPKSKARTFARKQDSKIATSSHPHNLWPRNYVVTGPADGKPRRVIAGSGGSPWTVKTTPRMLDIIELVKAELPRLRSQHRDLGRFQSSNDKGLATKTVGLLLLKNGGYLLSVTPRQRISAQKRGLLRGSSLALHFWTAF